jgi:PAS domain S-box-containing protein
MNDLRKTKKQLVDELNALRGRMALLEQDVSSQTPDHERNLLQTLIDNLPDLIYVKDRESRFRLANRAVLNQFGLCGPGEVIGKTDADFFPPSEAQAYLEEERRVLETGEALVAAERKAERPGGEPALALVTKVPLRDEHTGQIVGLVGLNHDITRLRQIEQEMRASERQHHLVLDALTDAIHAIDRDHRIVLVNQAFHDWLRRYKLNDEPLGRPLSEVVPFLPKSSFAQYEKVFTSGQGVECEFEASVQGMSIVVEVRKIPIIEANGVNRVATVLRDVTDRRRVEESLRQSEDRIRRMVKSLPIALFSFEAGTNRTLLAQGDVKRILGYERDRILADPTVGRQIVHPDDLPATDEAFRVGLASMQPFEVELRILHGETGAVRYVQQYIVPVGDDEGRLVRADSVVVDVTERRATEQALRESETRIRQLVDTLPVVLSSVEAETGRILLLWGDTRGILGYDHEQLFSDSRLGLSIVHPQDQAAAYKAFDQGMASRRPFSMTYRVVHGETGEPVYLQRYVVPVCDSNNRLVRHDSIIIDVTVEREAERRLKLLSQVAEQTTEGVAVADLDGKLLFLNRAFAALHGGEEADYLGRHMSVFHTAEQMPAVQQAIQTTIATGRFEGEIWHARKDGSTFLASMHTTLLRSESDLAVGVIGMMRDITTWKAMQASSALLAEAVKNAGEGIAIWNESWRLTYANASMLTIMGCACLEDLAALKPFSSILEQGQERRGSVRARLRKTGVWRGRLQGKRKDGSTVSFAAAFSRLVQDGGHQLVVGNFTDMSIEEAQVEQIRRLGREAASLLDDERARLSRELHDELGQQLTAMNLGLAWLESRLATAESEIVERLSEVRDVQIRMTQTVRDLARSLRPAVFDYQTLPEALQSLVGEYGQSSRITCHIKASPPDLDVPNPLKTAIYRIAQEALTNVLRHSGATRCELKLCRTPKGIELCVTDNGTGADPSRLEGTTSLGIVGMKERATALGGELRVDNLRRRGVRVTAVFPWSPAEQS